MEKQYDIFGNLTEPPKPTPKGRKKYKTMQELYGIKEGDNTCKTCVHLANGYYHGKSYYKCELWIVSHSSATDVRLKNKACNKYEEELTDERT
jgi:hypothetical protein